MTDIETLRRAAREILPLQQRDWLKRGLKHLRKDFRKIGNAIPRSIYIKVDFPPYYPVYNWLGSCTTIADCHIIHINPTVTGLLALDTLVHELVHAVVGGKYGHGRQFLEVAAAIGLDDDGPTAGAEEVLMQRLIEIRNILGPYPLVTDCLEAA